MKTSTTVSWIVVLLIIVLGGWYVWSMQKVEPAIAPSTNMGLNGSPNQTNTGQASVPPVLMTSSSAALGSYLVAANGMTLYYYTKDTPNASNCSGTCLANWPPYTIAADSPLVPGIGVTGKISTITRTDGTIQMTYNGMPLYFWKNDVKVEDTTGQNVGGVWFVVKP